MRELTEKQKRFALEYAIKCNAAQAAIAAGYSVKSSRYIGYKLLKNQRIAAMVKEALDTAQAQKVCDLQEVMEYLTTVMRGETEATIVVTERHGDGTSTARTFIKPPSEGERLRAAELIGKRYGLFTGRVDIDANVTPVIICGAADIEDGDTIFNSGK